MLVTTLTYLLLVSGTALMYMGFGTYSCLGEGTSGYIKDFVTDFLVMRNDEVTNYEDQCVRHYERCATPVTVTLEVYGRDVIASALKTPKLRSR